MAAIRVVLTLAIGLLGVIAVPDTAAADPICVGEVCAVDPSCPLDPCTVPDVVPTETPYATGGTDGSADSGASTAMDSVSFALPLATLDLELVPEGAAPGEVNACDGGLTGTFSGWRNRSSGVVRGDWTANTSFQCRSQPLSLLYVHTQGRTMLPSPTLQFDSGSRQCNSCNSNFADVSHYCSNCNNTWQVAGRITATAPPGFVWVPSNPTKCQYDGPTFTCVLIAEARVI